MHYALLHPVSSARLRFRFHRDSSFCSRSKLTTVYPVGTSHDFRKRILCSNTGIPMRAAIFTSTAMDLGGIALVLAGGFVVLAAFAAGISLAFQPTWVVRWVQKAQPDVFFLKPTEDKVISLTVDDAPHPDITPQILDVLRENDCKATFFVIGENVDQWPGLVERIHTEGHEVGNHTMQDAASWRLSPNEFLSQLIVTEERITKYFTVDVSGRQIKWFRPGHGFYTRWMLEISKAQGYKVALGSLFPLDTLFTAQAWLISKYLLWRMHRGAIIILHDRQPQKHQTIEVLKMILPVLKRKGYDVMIFHMKCALRKHPEQTKVLSGLNFCTLWEFWVR
ncbi:hypothetical protein R1flu_002151 [Riccia fluitans]|uniref:NodB homology domain-containing protein n=1 Tax=Riccia fluitans TaxID=41844 RepID=A0ABD1Y5P1_9MARC